MNFQNFEFCNTSYDQILLFNDLSRPCFSKTGNPMDDRMILYERVVYWYILALQFVTILMERTTTCDVQINS